MYIAQRSYGDVTVREFCELMFDVISPPILFILRKLFPKKFPMPKPPRVDYTLDVDNVEIQTADYKTFVCTVICRVSCYENALDYDKAKDAITMALEVVGSNMTYDEIIHGYSQFLEGAMQWDKLPELMGEDVEIYTTYIENIYYPHLPSRK